MYFIWQETFNAIHSAIHCHLNNASLDRKKYHEFMIVIKDFPELKRMCFL